MIFEFAVEPRLVAKWCGLNEYRYFGEKFGLGQPRVMAEYPVLKNWRRDVLRMTESLNDIEKERVLALISLLTERMVRRNGEYDGTRDWLENAIKEYQHWPFHAILATENSVGHEAVLPLASLGSGEPRWDLPHSQQPSRKALSLAKTVASPLELCSDVIFVDPHFNPSQLKYRRPLEAFLWSIVNRPSSDFPRRVEIQTGDDLGEAFFKSESVAKITPIVPRGMKIVLRRLKERSGAEKFHNRYILTDLGGVKFGIGLDDDDGNDGQTDDVDLMPRSQYELRWKQYATAHLAFDQVGEILEIVGTATKPSFVVSKGK